MDDKTLQNISNKFSTYKSGKSTVWLDNSERLHKRIREKLFGIDLSIFDDTIEFCKEVCNSHRSREQALQIAKDKAAHKKLWFIRERTSDKDYMHFYSESHFYIFRQPYSHRFGGFRWFVRLVDHIDNSHVLEYGCGSAILTEYLIRHFPNCEYTVADIPSATLDFIRWKKDKYDCQYEILEIGEGREGIPLERNYDLIICRDVLEHTPNPLEITEELIRHSNPGAVLCIDFLAAGKDVYVGENLSQALEQREGVKKLLSEQTICLKAIGDTMGDHDGLYVKPW